MEVSYRTIIELNGGFSRLPQVPSTGGYIELLIETVVMKKNMKTLFYVPTRGCLRDLSNTAVRRLYRSGTQTPQFGDFVRENDEFQVSLSKYRIS
jgi:hypothetical protein